MLKSLALAFACFSRLPAPKVDWEPENMRFMVAWLPLVGAVVGAFCAAWYLLCITVGFGPVLTAAGLTVIPVAVTGGFHLDGFADVIDAQSSHADPAKKRQIMKDSHIGAFAAMGVAAFFALYLGLASELPARWEIAAAIVCLHVMSRCGAAYASVAFWGNGTAGTLTTFRDSADVRISLAIIGVFYAAALVALVAVLPLCALVSAIAEIALLAWINWFAQKNFGGMSGDVAGFLLQSCEVVLLACIVVSCAIIGL